MRATQAVNSGSSMPIRSQLAASGHHNDRMRRWLRGWGSLIAEAADCRVAGGGPEARAAARRCACRTRPRRLPCRAMLPLAHLTWSDLGLVVSLFLSALVLCGIAWRTFARARR